MLRIRKLAMSVALGAGLLLAAAAPAFASVVCPVIGGPNNAQIKPTPADVPPKTDNPAHGADPLNPRPGDAFWL